MFSSVHTTFLFLKVIIKSTDILGGDLAQLSVRADKQHDFRCLLIVCNEAHTCLGQSWLKTCHGERLSQVPMSILQGLH